MNSSTKDIAICIKQLSKQYAKESMLLDLRSNFTNFFKKTKNTYFWALQDVTFDVKRGDIIGIIGENGSGKSTLLKILSGITKPTTGVVEIYGRVASILDIGAGFHPDLSGKENIYLKGQLLGMSQQSIDRHFEEIVAFSGIKDFIHMPIKHYSDGMFLRLAFSTLIHLDADILLLDEVLTVGDLAFQIKSMERIREMAKSGKTILMVSHQPLELVELCTGYVHLQNGKVVDIGNSTHILKNYLHTSLQKNNYNEVNDSVERLPNQIRWKDLSSAPGNDLFRLTQLAIFSPHLEDQLFMEDILSVELTYEKLTNSGYIDLAFSMNNEMVSFMICHPFRAQQAFQSTKAGTYRSCCSIPANLLNKGHYQIGIFAAANRKELLFSLPNALNVHVQSRTSLGAELDHFFDISVPLTPVFEWKLYEPTNEFITFT